MKAPFPAMATQRESLALFCDPVIACTSFSASFVPRLYQQPYSIPRGGSSSVFKNFESGGNQRCESDS